jgi:antitoxin component YwqK of YwqJK toxin-antitoxin module
MTGQQRYAEESEWCGRWDKEGCRDAPSCWLTLLVRKSNERIRDMFFRTTDCVPGLAAAGLLALLVVFCEDASAAPRAKQPAAASAGAAARNLELVNRPTRPADAEYTEPAVGTEVFTERYPDGKVKVEREVALDAEGNYVNHGPWRMWTASGQLIAEGNYEHGKRIGLWTRWHERNDSPILNQGSFRQFKPPFLSQANFIDDVMDGEWVIFDANQRKCCQVSLSHGKRDGLTIYWLPNETTIRQEMYSQGVPIDDVLELDPKTGQLVPTISYLNGHRLITEKSDYPRGKQPKIEANYLAPTSVVASPDDFWSLQLAQYKPEGQQLRHGKWQEWHSNGQLQASGQYDHDLRIGRFTYWHANGQKSAEGEFRNDKHDGTWAWWHENGQKAVSGQFRAGALIGDWRWWSEDGQLVKQIAEDGTQVFDSVAGEGAQFGKSAKSGQHIQR